jgi:hypothetical protein
MAAGGISKAGMEDCVVDAFGAGWAWLAVVNRVAFGLGGAGYDGGLG